MKTFLAKKETVQPKWYLIDAEGKVLGRIAVKAANIIRGRHKASYTPSVDTGDFVVVVNADKVRLTGSKETKKQYVRHTMHPGGFRSVNAETLRAAKPEDLILNAVRRMLPRNALGRQLMTKLKVYRGPTHPHTAQKPVALDIKA